ncbi:hypothetical protein N5J07_15030 [Comamonas aquatica]|uniref:DUF6900 domain-containing protein n=1 Tax=Comamonas aquatica TaxID=225991 RepID=UPI00244A59A8|nr:hypothetical protein [Comamonas aquatica]MDH1380744.1 hypothetical protein [Comamonas aquatica]MDH1640664.1 hypothetical protein [Comamonas aquatica]
MTHPTLNHIGQTILGLETLDTRNSDRLDFHDLAVWNIKAALQAAFEAGRQAGKTPRQTPQKRVAKSAE